MLQQITDQPKSGINPAIASKDRTKPLYSVTQVPSWYLCVFLAVQHFLTACGGIVSISLMISDAVCLQHDSLVQSRLINTMFFVSGLCTLLQVVFGVRLPIVQGCTLALLTPTLAVLNTPDWKCPAWTQNASLVNTSSPLFIEVWQTRLRLLQGSIMVASLFQILVGFSGLIGFLMRSVGPLTIAPTVTLIGLSLLNVAGAKAGSHWGISFMTVVLIALSSQYLKNIPVPLPTYNRTKKLHFSKFYFFQVMPILLGILVSWLLCYLLTVYRVLPSEPSHYGYLARTDVKGNVVAEASWFTFPYPGQWGAPTVNLACVLGIMGGIVCSMVESVGDYQTCAKLSGAPPPPRHAINRGIGVEGLGCLLAGAFGTGNGTTSFSQNVAVLGITKVGSRMVIILCGFFLVLLGIVEKIGAIFITIPEPVIGGMLMVIFGVITAAGVSYLQPTDMNSSRNIFVFGFSLFSALTISTWTSNHSGYIKTGAKEADEVILILLTTPMFLGGFLGFLLDNTIPGTRQERGLPACDAEEHLEGPAGAFSDSEELYHLPFGITACLSSQSWVRYVPFCPQQNQKVRCSPEDNDVEQSREGRRQTETAF